MEFLLGFRHLNNSRRLYSNFVGAVIGEMLVLLKFEVLWKIAIVYQMKLH